MKSFLFLFLILVYGFSTANAQSTLSGIWEGGLRLPNGSEIEIVFNIRGNAPNFSGTLDIPQQGALGLRLTVASLVEDSVTLVFEAGSTTGTFSGKMESDIIITGTYTQGGPVLSFGINRTGDVEALASFDNESNLIIEYEDIQIGGTLTLPTESNTNALLIMSSGSGAQDRNSTIYDFKIFEMIAQHLAENGIASFRYDDRGIGESSGNFANSSVEDLSKDVEEIINHFKSSEEHPFSEFILFGHSQGGIIAGKVAATNADVKQVILMASPVPPLSEILRYQGALSYAPLGIDSTLINAELDARDDLMKATQTGEDIDEVQAAYEVSYRAVLEALPPMQRIGIPDMDAAVRNQSVALRASYESPSLGSFLFYKAADDLSSTKVPVLGIFGGKDTQVTIDQNKAVMESALTTSGVNYEVVVFPDANHLFQKANTGLLNEYPILEKKFVDGLLEEISGWILAN